MLQGAEGTMVSPVAGVAAAPGQFPLSPVTMPDRVTSGHTPPVPADATSVPVLSHHPRCDSGRGRRPSGPQLGHPDMVWGAP